MSAFHVATGALLQSGKPPPSPFDASDPASPEPPSPPAASAGASAAASVCELAPLLVPVPPELVPEEVPDVNEPEVKTPALLDPEVTEPDVLPLADPDATDPELPDPEPLDEPLWLPELVPVDTTAGEPLSLQPEARRVTEAMMRVDTVVVRIQKRFIEFLLGKLRNVHLWRGALLAHASFAFGADAYCRTAEPVNSR
jgi:hypothetical protein